MTETIIKKLGIFDKTTREYVFTIVFEKAILDKPYYVHCNEKGDIVDLRKKQSYVNFLPTDKLKPVKEYYEVSANKSKLFDDECYIDVDTHYRYYIDWAAMASSIQKLLSSKVIFMTDIGGDRFLQRQAPMENIMHRDLELSLSFTTRVLIAKDSLGEDIPIPDRAIKQAKAREDKADKKERRNRIFETFVLPGLLDIEGFHYNTDNQKFYMDYRDIHHLIEKHIKEVVMPKFEEAGAQINIDDFEVGAFMYCDYRLPLEKVKLDNIDDVE